MNCNCKQFRRFETLLQPGAQRPAVVSGCSQLARFPNAVQMHPSTKRKCSNTSREPTHHSSNSHRELMKVLVLSRTRIVPDSSAQLGRNRTAAGHIRPPIGTATVNRWSNTSCLGFVTIQRDDSTENSHCEAVSTRLEFMTSTRWFVKITEFLASVR